jgi:hypothetical protein
MTSKRAFMRGALCLSGLFSFALVAAPDAQAQVPLYQEKFPYETGGGTQDEQLRSQGWCGGNAGDQFCDNPPGTGANNGGEGAISTGNGQDGDPGFAFWSQTGIGADSFLYTDEITFASSELSSITWYQRDSANDPLHLAFRIGTDWYISDQTWTQPIASTWVPQTVDLSSLTFFQRSQSGTALPDGSVPSSPGGLSLPSGDVNAFGFWWDGPKSNTSRVDTVTLLTADDDDDGIPDSDDACPDSDLSETVVIDSCDSGVTNAVDASGCTIADGVAACLADAVNHGGFVSCVSNVTNDFTDAGLISGRDKGAVQRCAARSDLP